MNGIVKFVVPEANRIRYGGTFLHIGDLFKGLNENKNGCKACDDKQESAKNHFQKHKAKRSILLLVF